MPSSKTQTTSSSSNEDLFNFDGTISSLSTLEAGGSGAMVYIIGGIVTLLAVALVAAVVFYVLKARKRSVSWSFSFWTVCKGKLQIKDFWVQNTNKVVMSVSKLVTQSVCQLVS